MRFALSEIDLRLAHPAVITEAKHRRSFCNVSIGGCTGACRILDVGPGATSPDCETPFSEE
jgi:hypothetical protein